MAALVGAPVALVIVYASVRYDLPELLAGIRSVTGDAPLVGASSSGHFHTGALTEPGAGVAVLALSAGRYRFGIGVAGGLSSDAFGCGAVMARAARDGVGPDRHPHAALLVLADGLGGDQQRMLDGAYQITGAAVHIVGGAAADDRRLRQAFVFCDGQVLTDAAVGVWIDSPWPLGVVCGHGWRTMGLPLLVTHTEGTLVHEISGRPAAEVYHEQCGVGAATLVSRLHPGEAPAGNVGDQAPAACGYGLVQPDGELVIRGVYLDWTGALHTFAPLPPYSAVQFAYCHPGDILEVIGDVVKRAFADRRPSVLLSFSCVARLDILGEHGGEEAHRLQRAAGDVPTFGFYTYGEFARTATVSGYHNATLAGIAL